MGYLALRQLFELLCDGLEGEESSLALHFVEAFDVELPQQVLMIFLFQEGVICFSFPVEDDFDCPHEIRSLSSESLNLDTCLDMSGVLAQHDGNFSALFA